MTMFGTTEDHSVTVKETTLVVQNGKIGFADIFKPNEEKAEEKKEDGKSMSQ